jgi:hypothetical protein
MWMGIGRLGGHNAHLKIDYHHAGVPSLCIDLCARSKRSECTELIYRLNVACQGRCEFRYRFRFSRQCCDAGISYGTMNCANQNLLAIYEVKLDFAHWDTASMLMHNRARRVSTRTFVPLKTEGIMIADARSFKVTKLARSGQATAKSITSVDNELMGERGEKIRGRVLGASKGSRF